MEHGGCNNRAGRVEIDTRRCRFGIGIHKARHLRQHPLDRAHVKVHLLKLHMFFEAR